MHEPAHEDDPQEPREDEVNDGREDAALHELPEPGNEKTTNGGDDVASGSLTSHMQMLAKVSSGRNLSGTRPKELLGAVHLWDEPHFPYLASELRWEACPDDGA